MVLEMDPRGIHEFTPARPAHPVRGAEDHTGMALPKVQTPGRHERFLPCDVPCFPEDSEHACLGIDHNPENASLPDCAPPGPFEQCSHLSYRGVDAGGGKDRLKALDANQSQEAKEGAADRKLDE